MKHLIFAVGIFLFLASSAVAAENSYPPPPDPGKALSIEDSILAYCVPTTTFGA